MKTILQIPFPPSVNSLYDGGMKTKRRFKSERYKQWLYDAQLQVLSQTRNHHTGDVAVSYTFCKPDKRRRDLGNAEKSVSDLLCAMDILRDDSQIVRMLLQWGDKNEVVVEDV